MALTLDEVRERINNMHLDEHDIEITRDGDGFSIRDSDCGGWVEDIGCSFEVPDTADEHGRHAFTAGPWTAYQYHPSYVSPRFDNYSRELEDLVNGDVRAIIVGATAIIDGDDDQGTWVLGIRTVGGS